MTTATPPTRLRPPFVALVAYTLRSCLPGRRWVGVAAPAAAALLFGFIASTVDDTPASAFAGVASSALFSLVLPVTCLVVGDAVLGAEVRSGTFAFTFMAPVPTWKIAVARWLGGTIAAAGTLAVAFALAALVAGTPESAGPVAVSAAFGAGAYVAIFEAIGCLTNRAAVWSLAFVFLVERLLGSALAGIAQLSPAWESAAAFIGNSDGREDYVREGIPHGTSALVRLALIAAVAVAIASSRLKHLRVTGSAD
jgi:ABC-type transport system involved in multi-copper enzyme maturation permease subunit